MLVVVAGVFAEDHPQVPLAEDQRPVGALGSCGAYPSLAWALSRIVNYTRSAGSVLSGGVTHPFHPLSDWDLELVAYARTGVRTESICAMRTGSLPERCDLLAGAHAATRPVRVRPPACDQPAVRGQQGTRGTSRCARSTADSSRVSAARTARSAQSGLGRAA